MTSTEPETFALLAIDHALQDLDRNQCKRVLDWARSRYVDADILTTEETTKALSNFVFGLEEIAKKLSTSPLDVLSAMQRVATEADRSDESDGESQ